MVRKIKIDVFKIETENFKSWCSQRFLLSLLLFSLIFSLARYTSSTTFVNTQQININYLLQSTVSKKKLTLLWFPICQINFGTYELFDFSWIYQTCTLSFPKYLTIWLIVEELIIKNWSPGIVNPTGFSSRINFGSNFVARVCAEFGVAYGYGLVVALLVVVVGLV